MSDKTTYYINDVEVDPAKEHRDLFIEATFEENIVQPNIGTDSLTFAGRAQEEIEKQLASPMGIMMAPILKIKQEDGTNEYTFTTYIDFRDEFIRMNEDRRQTRCTLMNIDGIINFADRAKGITYEYLLNKGTTKNNSALFASSDYVKVPYIVDKFDTAAERAVLFISTFVMVSQLNNLIFNQTNGIIQQVKVLISAPLQKPAEIAQLIAQLALSLAYVTAIIIALSKLASELVNIYLPVPRYIYGIRMRRAIEKAVNYLGYDFVTDVADMAEYVYLPSKPNEKRDKSKIGLPRSGDYGYLVSEMFQIAKDTFNGQFGVIEENGKMTIHFHSSSSDFWQKTAVYILPDVLGANHDMRYNLNELIGTRKISAAVDQADEWTVENYGGTSYEVMTGPKGFENIPIEDRKRVMSRGIEEINLGVALGNRKDKLSDLQEAFTAVVRVINDIKRTFGGAPTQANLNSLGCLKLSRAQFFVPKLIMFDSLTQRIPADHRNRLSAKYLWQTYYKDKSFKPDNTIGGQFRIYKGVKIPFKLADFMKIVQTKYFLTADYKQACFDYLKWNVDRDYAVVDIRVKDTYTDNIEEVFIEPQ